MNFPRVASVCDGTPGDTDGAGVILEETVSSAIGLLDAAGFGVVLGVVRGAGVALGTINRPRRCDAVGKGDADDVGVAVVAGADDCCAAALRGVNFGSGVDVAATDGACVADTVADGNGVAVEELDMVEPASVVGFDALMVFMNFFDGAFEGGAASDFILSRVFLAAS